MTPPVSPLGLDPQRLNHPKEQTYFVGVLVLSLLVWALIALSVIGLVYGLIIAFFLWLGSGLLVALLRSEAVRVSEQQLPRLYATFNEVCARLGVAKPPALYVLQAGGLLNAFATRHAGRDFVVVFSDMLEAVGPDSVEMKFILGHELGHLKSRHIAKQIFLAPGMFFPLIGPAYRRAWESSCDRYGAYAAQDVEGAVRAMLILSGGAEHGRHLHAEAFAAQHTDERGFFVSLHELTSSYPTLSARVTALLALRTGELPRRPARNPVAYLLAAFMPGGNLGGGGGPAGALVVVVIIGLLAAMAIPAFQKVRTASQEKACVNNQRMLVASLDQYLLENGKGPASWDDIVGVEATKYLKTMPACPNAGTYSANYSQELKGFVVECSVHGSHQTNPPRARP